MSGSGIPAISNCGECRPSVAHMNNTSEVEQHLRLPSIVVDEDDELVKYIWREYLQPKQYEWVLIAGYIIVFFVSLIGNSLVCFAVWKNWHMRTVTNYFIVNLSIADVLVTLTCLPASLVVDITETWFFGNTLCKIVPYLQTISVSVSVLTLSCIAQDRWYAICHPLMFKSTAKRARKTIVLIWLVSCIIMVPQAIVMECTSLFPELTNMTILFTVCDEHWGDEIYPKVYHTCFFIATYFAPLCFMVLAYIQICHKLWCQQIPGSSLVMQRKWYSFQCTTQASGPGESARVRTNTVCAEVKQVRARRKTARMLIVVLFIFALCYLPISVLNMMKRVFGSFKNSNDRETIYAWFTFSHWLIYANSAANPIVYNFLSGKFREEFKAAFSCHCAGQKPSCAKRQTRASTDRRRSLSMQANNVDNVSRISDQVVLSNNSVELITTHIATQETCIETSGGSCLERIALCLGDQVCNRNLGPLLQTCSAEQCNRTRCRDTSLRFYGGLPVAVADLLVMCDCGPGEKDCQRLATMLHSGTCGDDIWSCQEGRRGRMQSGVPHINGHAPSVPVYVHRLERRRAAEMRHN
ncbi:unnamed protein product [Lota lota]